MFLFHFLLHIIESAIRILLFAALDSVFIYVLLSWIWSLPTSVSEARCWQCRNFQCRDWAPLPLSELNRATLMYYCVWFDASVKLETLWTGIFLGTLAEGINILYQILKHSPNLILHCINKCYVRYINQITVTPRHFLFHSTSQTVESTHYIWCSIGI